MERDEASRSQRIAEPFPIPGKKGKQDPHRPVGNSDQSLATITLLRWRLILLCMVICILLAGLVTLVLPKKYESEVQFLVKNESRDLTITPAQNTSPSQLSELNEAEVNSEMRMLLSHDLLEGGGPGQSPCMHRI